MSGKKIALILLAALSLMLPGIAYDLDEAEQDGGGAIEVAGDEQRAAALLFEPVGEFGGGGGFAGAVEAADEDVGRLDEVERGLVAT